jgi:hypothetical protein
MRHMLPKVLALCALGQSRSRWLAEYLQGLGYDAAWAGVSAPDRAAVQAAIDAADVLVTAHPTIEDALRRFFRTDGKAVVSLDAPDWGEVPAEELRAVLLARLRERLPL